MPDPQIAIVIPAGGGGTRLWPRSRSATPKQFLDIVSERTMLQETADRVAELVPPSRVFVITNADHADSVRAQMPDVPAQNIVGEPIGRDSAPAIGLMAALLEKTLGPDAVMAVLPADHVIPRRAEFQAILRRAAAVAENGFLVTLGIPPTGPDVGFGYIQAGQEMDGGAFVVEKFREKPDAKTAEEYVNAGSFFWNAGMYIVTVKTLRELYKTHLPQMESAFGEIADAYGTPTQTETMTRVFPTLEKVSIDYGISEKADKVAVLPADIGWNDVGDWARLAEVLASDGDADNIVVGHHLGVDTHDALIYSPNRLIATIGMSDFIVIDTPDATLICPKSRSQDVKKIVEELKARGRGDLL